MEDNIELLNLMLKDQESADSLFKPGPYWKRYQSRMLSSIRKNGILNFRKTSSIGDSWADSLMRDPFDLSHTYKGTIAKTLLNAPILNSIKARYDNIINHYIDLLGIHKSHSYSHFFSELVARVEQESSIPDTLLGGCEDIVSINNNDYSALYIRYLARLCNFEIQGSRLTNSTNFMEIGGGISGTTHLALSLFPNIRKILYIDMPPVIYISTEYLRHFFPNNVVDYRQTRNLEVIEFKDDDSLEILCLCPWQVSKIAENSADLLYNSASFSEMTPKIVENYATNFKNILRPDSEINLFINKTEPHPDLEITMPEEIYNAFAPDFSFKSFDPKWEFPNPQIYSIGQRVLPD